MIWIYGYFAIGAIWGTWLTWDIKDVQSRRLRVALWCIPLWPVSALSGLVLLVDSIVNRGRE